MHTLSRPFIASSSALLLLGCLIAAPSTADAAPLILDSVGTCTDVAGFSAPGGRTFTAPATANSNRDCRLQQGNQGPAVARLQQELADGCDSLPQNIAVDGRFGPATRAALHDAQRFLGVTADGIYGSQTASRFIWQTTDKQLCYAPGL